MAKKSRRTFEDSFKIEVLRDAERLGATAAAKMHKLPAGLIYRWRKKFHAVVDRVTPESVAENQATENQAGVDATTIDQELVRWLSDQLGEDPMVNYYVDQVPRDRLTGVLFDELVTVPMLQVMHGRLPVFVEKRKLLMD